MDVERFCSEYQLPDSVKKALNEQDFDGPRTLLSLPIDLFTEPSDKKGLGLRIGAAIRLKNALISWVKGESSPSIST
jgi:hypothetical protein